MTASLYPIQYTLKRKSATKAKAMIRDISVSLRPWAGFRLPHKSRRFRVLRILGRDRRLLGFCATLESGLCFFEEKPTNIHAVYLILVCFKSRMSGFRDFKGSSVSRRAHFVTSRWRRFT